MVIIKTTCPRCGEVDLTADKVELRIAIGGGKGTSYAFDCPRCTDRIRKAADARIAQLLISGGVSPEVISEDQETAQSAKLTAQQAAQLAAREQHPARAVRASAAAITYDDLLEFHAELESGVLESFLRNSVA